jgi:hypothetical protein
MILTRSTLEVRWFESGALPTEVQGWFCSDCPGELVGLPEEREDKYLKVPNCQTFSLKQRQNNLELKFLQAKLGIARFGKSDNTERESEFWQGQLERWCKFSCKDSVSIAKAFTELSPKKLWINVKKIRWQKQYRAIFYEITQLEINNSIWWSIAFEMAQQKASEINHFKNVVGQAIQNCPLSELTAENSYAYPNWLARQFP